MRKLTTISTALLLLVIISTANAAELRLTQKNQSTWVEVTGGSTATLTYNEVGATFDYTLVGNVPNDIPYSLIYYKDQTNRFVNWGLVGAVIAENIDPDGSNGNSISVSGSKNIGNIPQVGDLNYPNGAKIWLVPTENVHVASDGNTLIPDWNPTAYLFEENLPNAINGIPSHLISYKVGSSLSATTTILKCPTVTDGLNGFTVESSVIFGDLYPNNVKTVTIPLTVTQTSPNSVPDGSGCPVGDSAPGSITVSASESGWGEDITVGTMTFNGNSIPTFPDTSTPVEFEYIVDPSTLSFVLTVSASPTMGEHTNTITLTQMS